tara:strand:+ start:426998 stop:427342 length:345 start_codon:yes stop_codon:yes gene_type:complete
MKKKHDSSPNQARTDQVRKPVRGLVVLNIALLCGLGAISFSQSATAQMGSKNDRVRGEYTIVGGSTLGSISNMIYVLDSANREMIALSWNDSTKGLDGVGYRDLNLDSSSDPDR